ncbi:MAG: TetR/AcrR family transcriptional regulator [Bryobacteraceae bacterium]
MKRRALLVVHDECAAPPRRRAKRLDPAVRRAQVLQAASAQFAITGLHGTSTVALAKAAGVAKPVVYAHFGSKECLFREAVEANIEARLRTLAARLEAIARERYVDCIEGMAESTVAVCASGPGNAVLTNWALLEAPEYAADLYRNEIGLVQVLWKRELARRLPDSPLRSVLSVHVVPYIVNACLAYGFWLSAFRHSAESARLLARQFAAGIAQAASAVLERSLQNRWAGD